MMKQHKKATLENDFERMVPEFHKHTVTYAEHMVRYEAVRSVAEDKLVLDIASGSGYGTAIIAQHAQHVYGVDVSKEAVAYAKENYSAKNIDYLVGDGEKIPLGDNSVDVVVSFETIEHIADYEQFMREVKRVLKPDGLLLLSTPNDREFAEGNHFHLHEFEYDELTKLVKDYFKETKNYFQCTWISAALTDERMFKKEWQQPIATMQLAPLKRDQVLYFFILCANRPITETVEPLSGFGEHWSARKLQQKDQEISDKIHELKEYAEHLESLVRSGETKVARLEADLSETRGRLRAIISSRSWKLAQKIVRGKRKLLGPRN